MKRLLFLMALVASVLGAAVSMSISMQSSVPDNEIGLSKTSVFDTPAPPAYQENSEEPGENFLLARNNPVGPPLVPHLVADFLPITREDNLCIDCHLVEEKEEGAPIPIPESHYIDDRNAPGEARKTPAGTRYICTACHVPQTDAAPLVGTRTMK